MTREEYIDFANALKNNYTIDFDKLPEFCDMAISALSENKGDLISRQAVENITWEEPSYSDPLNVLTEVREKVRALPSVENKGEWIYQEGVTPYKWRCNKCEKMFKTDFNFCPNCGADMREPTGEKGET